MFITFSAAFTLITAETGVLSPFETLRGRLAYSVDVALRLDDEAS